MEQQGILQVKRSPINPVSKKRLALYIERRDNLQHAWGPKPWTCYLNLRQDWKAITQTQTAIVPHCMGEVNAHEIVKRSQGGSITDVSNMVPLCNVHNSWVETAPRDVVKSLGLVKSRWE